MPVFMNKHENAVDTAFVFNSMCSGPFGFRREISKSFPDCLQEPWVLR